MTRGGCSARRWIPAAVCLVLAWGGRPLFAASPGETDRLLAAVEQGAYADALPGLRAAVDRRDAEPDVLLQAALVRALAGCRRAEEAVARYEALPEDAVAPYAVRKAAAAC